VTPDPWLEPLFDAAATGAIDRWAIDEVGIDSLTLMETAGGALARETEQVLQGSDRASVRIVCGKGNNGGDGLVAARLLRDAGHEVDALLLWPAAELSPDSSANLDRLGGDFREVAVAELPEALAGSGAIVDAVFGTGFEGAPRAPADAAVAAINAAGAPVVACDMPSGVDGSTGEAAGAAVEADLTVTFHTRKLGQYVAPGKRFAGRVVAVPIGIPDGGPAGPIAGIIGTDVLGRAPSRGAGSTKFSSGEVVVVGGSRGLTGAPAMAATAAIRAGAGYATVGCPASLEAILEVKLTEVMTVALDDVDGGLDVAAIHEVLERSGRAACVVLGPGIGRAAHTQRLVRDLSSRIDAPLLIDADGLNALGTDLGLLAGRAQPTVLTPHAGELGRLLDIPSEEVGAHRLASARRAAAESESVVVLKGDDTIVVSGDRVAVNALPSPGLATAGTGDVLSGTIGGLIARGMDAFEAACAAVLAHARAGRVAADRHGADSVIATDVIAALPEGLRG